MTPSYGKAKKRTEIRTDFEIIGTRGDYAQISRSVQFTGIPPARVVSLGFPSPGVAPSRRLWVADTEIGEQAQASITARHPQGCCTHMPFNRGTLPPLIPLP
jgi:hypothetical protein